MEPSRNNHVGYRLYMFTFVGLSALTLLAVWFSHILLPPVVEVGIIMVIALLQASIVLFYNMHLKFQEKILLVFVLSVFGMLLALIGITLFDYIFR